MNIYHLGQNQPGRRAGLTKRAYKGARLLQTINDLANEAPNDMAPKAFAKRSEAEVEQEKEADFDFINRPPEMSSSDDENPSADIRPTVFAAVEQTKKQPVRSKGRSPASSKAKSTSSESSSTPSTRVSPKRKSQGDPPVQLGAGMADAFGRIRTNNNKKKKSFGYGSIPNLLGINYPSHMNAAQIRSGARKDPPKKPFVAAPPLDSPQNSNLKVGRSFKRPDILESPVSTPEKSEKFRKAAVLCDLANTPASTKKYKTSQMLLSSPLDQSVNKQPKFKKFEINDSFEESDTDAEVSSPILPKYIDKPLSFNQIPATQRPGFKTFEDLEDLLGTGRDTLERVGDVPITASQAIAIEDEPSTMSQGPRCPMCNDLVEPEDLLKIDGMNIRAQEIFCRAHKKKTAKEHWRSQGYPDIDWGTFDTRISRHHSFIRDLIKGADCHYRALLDEKVNAGKDRTLLKMTTNLTPGYYGSRGLRVISEHIMETFTPLLKRRNVQDRLMSARGVAGFVQSVLVPEVVVLLIMEDMDVEIERARDILADSAGTGELVNEEIHDVVREGVEDSEYDDDEEI